MPPFFIVFSRPRCGSSALCRALEAHADATCLFEPSFERTDGSVDAVGVRLDELRREASGMKHVWEHAGPPFWPAILEAAQLTALAERVFAANRAVAQMPGARVVTLRRRDQWARAVSHLLSQQTDLWGMSYRDGRWEIDGPEAYRSALRAAEIAPLDIGVLEWYLTRGTDEERRLIEAARVNPCLDVVYEDMLGPGRDVSQRLEKYCEVLEFLGLSTDRSAWDADRVAAIVAPDRKLNGPETFDLIPNIAQVRRLRR